MDYETRQREGDFTYEHTAARTTGDSVAQLLVAFHAVVKPLAKERCSLNPKTGKHLASIENTNGKFVPHNTPYVVQLFPRLLGPNVAESQWFQLHHVKLAIEEMLVEVCKKEQGRWQWRGFYLLSHEWEEASFRILQAYVAGLAVIGCGD